MESMWSTWPFRDQSGLVSTVIPTSGPPGQYVHFPWGQAYGLGITATVVTPLALRICLPIRRGLSRMSSDPGTRWRRSELGGTVGDLCSLQTSILIRLTSSREGQSRLSRRSTISIETCSVVWLNPLIPTRVFYLRELRFRAGQLWVFRILAPSKRSLDLALL